jgi:hypothetical protein
LAIYSKKTQQELGRNLRMLKFPLWNNFWGGEKKKTTNTCNKMGGEKEQLGRYTQEGKNKAVS